LFLIRKYYNHASLVFLKLLTLVLHAYMYVFIRARIGTVSGTVPARNNVGSVRLWKFLFWSRNMLSIFSVLSEMVTTDSRSAHPTYARRTDCIHSNSYTNTHRPTRHPRLDIQSRSAIIILTTVIFVA